MSKTKVTYVDHMGTDLSVCRAARVSFAKESEWEYDFVERRAGDGEWIEMKENPKLSERDKGLIQFLARGCTSGDWDNLVCDLDNYNSWDQIDDILRHVKNMPTHWTPFGHTAITLHIKAPIFVARQLGKHQVGMVWNEVSRRYVTDEPEFYVPDVWRKAADNVKQGSSDQAADWPPEGTGSAYTLEHLYPSLAATYHRMIKAGVCPEQARMVLPQSMMTEWYWTGNLYAFANVFIQRTDSHAQQEAQMIGKQIGEIIEPLFPVSWAALTK